MSNLPKQISNQLKACDPYLKCMPNFIQNEIKKRYFLKEFRFSTYNEIISFCCQGAFKGKALKRDLIKVDRFRYVKCSFLYVPSHKGS